MGTTVDPQTDSLFINILPKEIREAIYLELWRPFGLRQHIVWHADFLDDHKSHFCRWRCSTEYHVEDHLQEEIEVLRQHLGLPLGKIIENARYSRRLQSPWLNHWPCGERIEEIHGETPAGATTSGGNCWIKSLPNDHTSKYNSPYMPMLQLCKLISNECLGSLYRSITFIFTDTMALQMFVGFCHRGPVIEDWQKFVYPSPGFRQHGRSLELSCTPDFPRIIYCPVSSPRNASRLFQSACNFHWLQLDHFRNLRSVKIWVASRSVGTRIGSDDDFVHIAQLSVTSLEETMFSICNSGSVILSTPLSKEIGAEDGYISDPTRPETTVWKRGSGDRYHPAMTSVNPGGPVDGLIWTSTARELRFHTKIRIEPEENICYRPLS